MKIKFWGVRGSIACSGEEYSRYGGNTLCTEIENNGREIIFDAGTGIRNLGNDLIKRYSPNKIEVYLFLSHTHWDHIQGFPFFAPAYIQGNKIHIFGAEKVDTNLEQTLAGQMLYHYFPISLKQLGAKIDFNDVKEGQPIEFLDFTVKNVKLNHPFPGVFAYRLEDKATNKSIVYATDTEHYDCLDNRLLKLAEKANILIYDAQYTPEEYPSKISWGHSTGQKGIEIAEAAQVSNLVLFHHDPSHTDRMIDEILRNCKLIRTDKNICVIAAREGLELNI